MPTLLPLANPSFETGDTSGWAGTLPVIQAGGYDGLYHVRAASSGLNYFWQDLVIPEALWPELDLGGATLSGFYCRHRAAADQLDAGYGHIVFLDAVETELYHYRSGRWIHPDWIHRAIGTLTVPIGTRTVRVMLENDRSMGTQNNNYWDAFSSPSLSIDIPPDPTVNEIQFNILENSNEFFAYEFEADITVAQNVDPNPYKPQIPESVYNVDLELYNYQQENQEILRQQHNITQAGDTTFPWFMCLDSHPVKQFNLGALSRFYHDEYGIIIARYVQFAKMIQTPTVAAPVGLLRREGKLNWRVTNDIIESSPMLVVGIMSTLTFPVNDSYGWVIVDGANIAQLDNESFSYEAGESFVWLDSGKIGNEGVGMPIAQRVHEPTDLFTPKGGLRIRIDLWSRGGLNQVIATETTYLREDTERLDEEVARLNTLLKIDAAKDVIAELWSAIEAEGVSRNRGSDLIQSQLEALGVAEMSNTLARLAQQFELEQAAQNQRIDSALARALEALNAANQALSNDTTSAEQMLLQIELLLARLDTLESTTRSKFPVVDGSIPPNLMYLDDGSLVFTEE